ncbi:hypothetical protein RA210_U280023 [Rubrivivax sp. A210]|nr:hypothetical protein RA210_U280023 [Rubrivivax sp. A210]
MSQAGLTVPASAVCSARTLGLTNGPFAMPSNVLSAESVADRVDNLKARLQSLVAEINSSASCQIMLHQQSVIRKHISLSGGNGRMYIAPTASEFDISLSGHSLTQELSPFMTDLCGPRRDYKHRKHLREPYWRVSDFQSIERAVKRYSQTRPTSGIQRPHT